MNKDAQEVSITIGGAEVTIRAAGQTPEDTAPVRSGLSRDLFDGDTKAPQVGTGAFLNLPAAEQKRLLLKHYTREEPKRFVQYDSSGDCAEAWACETVELMQTLGLRVLIDPAIPGAASAAELRLIANWIEREGYFRAFDPDSPFPCMAHHEPVDDSQASPAPGRTEDDPFWECDPPPGADSKPRGESHQAGEKLLILDNLRTRGVVECLELHHGFLHQEPDDCGIRPDADGDWEEACMQTEVRLPYFGDVCVHIRPGVTQTEAVRLLRKTANGIELRGLFRDGGQA